jgi:hypothetical protein
VQRFVRALWEKRFSNVTKAEAGFATPLSAEDGAAAELREMDDLLGYKVCARLQPSL